MSEQKPPYDWTVMVYLAGNNSLSDECVFALTEMTTTRIDSGIAVVAQLNTGVHDRTTLSIHNGMTPDEIHVELNKALMSNSNSTWQREKGSQPPQNHPTAEEPRTHKDRIFGFVRD